MQLFVTDSPRPFLVRRTLLLQGNEDSCLDLKDVLDCAGLPEPDSRPDTPDTGRWTIPKFLSLICGRPPESREKIEQALALLVKEKEQKKNVVKIYPQRSLDLRKPIEPGSKVIVVGHRAPVSRAQGGMAGKMANGFFKFASALADPGAEIRLPDPERSFAADGVLGVVIGKRAERVPISESLSCVAGFTLLIDVTDRKAFEEESRTNNNLLAKNHFQLSPIGPSLCLATEGQFDRGMEITLRVNGQVRQQFSLGDLAYGVEEMVSTFSRLILEPGDILGLGATIARARPGKILESPVPVKPGDVLDVESRSIGVLKTEIKG